MASVSAIRVESVEQRGDAVGKLQRLRKALQSARTDLLEQGVRTEDDGLRRQLSELADGVKGWDQSLEELREELASLVSERDRWKIAHDKLRERMDHHSLQPRMEMRRVQSTQMPAVRPSSSPDGQDFATIDRELEQLNESMLRAFSSE